MFGKTHDIPEETGEAGKRGVSMDRRLRLYWLCMALAVFTAVILLLGITGVFSISDQKLHETLFIQEQNTAANLSEHLDVLTAKCIRLSGQVSDEITDTLSKKGKTFDSLNDDPGLIAELEHSLYTPLNSVLQSSPCSSAFIVLDATCNTAADGADTSRMGIYLRYSDLSDVNSANKHTVYFRGVSDVARAEQIQMHNRWNLEFDTAFLPRYSELVGTGISST